MNLAGLFQYENKSSKNSGASGSESMSSGHSVQAVKGWKPGQAFQGEIVGKNGNEVQIRVAPDVIITARLDKEMNVSVGQSMTFEVKNNSGSQIALRPLFENLAQDANVLKALNAARLPATAEFMRMVSSMMEQGMSINKNSLLDMSKLVASCPGTNPEVIVWMKNMNISLTPQNIEQFENYQRYEHQILSGINDIIGEIPGAFHGMAGAGQEGAALNFYTQLLGLVTGSQIAETGTESAHVFSDIRVSADAAGNTAGAEISTDNTAMRLVRTESSMMQDLLNIAGETNAPEQGSTAVQGGGGDNAALGRAPDSLAAVLDKGARQQLANLLAGLGFGEERLVQVQKGNISGKQLLAEISLLLTANTGMERENILKLFGSRELNQILTKELMQQWLIKPEQVAKKEDVEAFYNRLREQTMRLTQELGQAAKDTPLAKSLANIQNNIEFMNQVNQMFNYIQLPLKMSGGDAHGDLYVYTNKRGTGREDGSVSALLHLDMEHMGAMDIYVLMQDKNVSTKFYFENEAMLDFAAQHIYLLNERLEKRGYSLETQMLTIEEAENANAITPLTGDGDRTVSLAQYSFDVRA